MPVLLSEDVEDSRVRVLTLNRPEVMNAFNTELAQKLGEALDAIYESPKVRVVVVTGAGERAFSAGGDFKERSGMTDSQWNTQHRLFEEVHSKVRSCPRPIICAANGFALGGGCELALSTDFVYASKNAKFGVPEVTRGIIPGVGGTQLLGKLMPRGKALELLLTGKQITAQEAFEWGLVNAVTEPADLMKEVLATARTLCKNSPFALTMAKRAFKLGIDLPLDLGIEVALQSYYRTVSHPDRVEGVNAFNEKREPVYLDNDK